MKDSWWSLDRRYFMKKRIVGWKLLPRSILIEKSYLRWKYPHEPGKDDKKAPPYSSQESVMARLSGSGSSIKVWLEGPWSTSHKRCSWGIDLQERVDKTLQLNCCFLLAGVLRRSSSRCNLLLNLLLDWPQRSLSLHSLDCTIMGSWSNQVLSQGRTRRPTCLNLATSITLDFVP